MANLTPKDIVANAKADFTAKLAAYNVALTENDFSASEAALAELKASEAQYAADKQAEVFAELKTAENPIEAGVRRHHYGVVSHKLNRENGVVTGAVETERARQVDLVALCEACGISSDWKFLVERFNQLLAVRTATELKIAPEKIKKIQTSYFMQETARKVELGATPMSNSALTKMLQAVIDAILFVDNGNGQNVYRVFAQDVRYLLGAYTTRSKQDILTLRLAKTKTLHEIIADILHRIVVGRAYDVDVKFKKESEVSAKPAEKAPKISEPSDDSEDPEVLEGYGSEETSEESAE